MIVQVDKLFINTDTITTISAYEKRSEKATEIGFTINGINYILISVDNNDAEKLNNSIILANNIVSTIVSKIVNPVQRLNLEPKEVKEEKND